LVFAPSLCPNMASITTMWRELLSLSWDAVMKPGTVSQAAGSAYAEFGNTKVMVGV